MSLTKEERQELIDVLDRTGQHRKEGVAQKAIPEKMYEYTKLVDREEQIITVDECAVPFRIVITKAKDRAAGCPLLFNMHGGGFIFKQDSDDDLFCARLAAELHAIVVDIDYASSLNDPYPAAFDQCYGTIKKFIAEARELGADPNKTATLGHSAGGCLVMSIALRANETGDFTLGMQVMDYAANDNYFPLVTPGNERSRAFSLLYTDGDEELLKDPHVSAIYATDEMLKNMPRTLIINAAKCPFCEMNEELGMRMVKMGNEVTMRRFTESRHGFTIRFVDEWDEAQTLIVDQLRTL